MNKQATSQIDTVAAQVKRAQSYASFAMLAADTDAGRTEHMARLAVDAAGTALRGLQALGAAEPGPAVARDVVPLALLDTPAVRRLLAALEVAAEAGADVDRERGALDASGEPIGYGEVYAEHAERLRVETFGAVSRLE